MWQELAARMTTRTSILVPGKSVRVWHLQKSEITITSVSINSLFLCNDLWKLLSVLVSDWLGSSGIPTHPAFQSVFFAASFYEFILHHSGCIKIQAGIFLECLPPPPDSGWTCRVPWASNWPFFHGIRNFLDPFVLLLTGQVVGSAIISNPPADSVGINSHSLCYSRSRFATFYNIFRRPLA